MNLRIHISSKLSSPPYNFLGGTFFHTQNHKFRSISIDDPQNWKLDLQGEFALGVRDSSVEFLNTTLESFKM
jgi:hypothetical protein